MRHFAIFAILRPEPSQKLRVVFIATDASSVGACVHAIVSRFSSYANSTTGPVRDTLAKCRTAPGVQYPNNRRLGVNRGFCFSNKMIYTRPRSRRFVIPERRIQTLGTYSYYLLLLSTTYTSFTPKSGLSLPDGNRLAGRLNAKSRFVRSTCLAPGAFDCIRRARADIGISKRRY